MPWTTGVVSVLGDITTNLHRCDFFPTIDDDPLTIEGQTNVMLASGVYVDGVLVTVAGVLAQAGSFIEPHTWLGPGVDPVCIPHVLQTVTEGSTTVNIGAQRTAGVVGVGDEDDVEIPAIEGGLPLAFQGATVSCWPGATITIHVPNPNALLRTVFVDASLGLGEDL